MQRVKFLKHVLVSSAHLHFRFFLPRFAFVDFTSIEHATGALINTKNHQLNGRNLVVEYASPDAVRRGAPKEKRQENDVRAPKRKDYSTHKRNPERPELQHGRDRPSLTKESREQGDPELVTREEAEVRRAGIGRTPSSRGDEQRKKGPRSRPKPGAALALAKRESAAIVPSQGQKITF